MVLTSDHFGGQWNTVTSKICSNAFLLDFFIIFLASC